MNRYVWVMVVVLFMLPGICVWSGDIRQVYRQLEQEREQQQRHHQATVAKIRTQKDGLRRELEARRRQVQKLREEKRATDKRLAEAQEQVGELKARRNKDDARMEDLAAAVRSGAGNLAELMQQSVFSALDPLRFKSVEQIRDKSHFPGLADLDLLAEYYLEDMRNASMVQVANTPYTNISGRHEQGAVLFVGPFLTYAMEAQNKTLLEYSPQHQELCALDVSLEWSHQKLLEAYADGKSDVVPVDLEAGAGLEKLKAGKTFVERVSEGGVLVWPIVLIAVFAVLIGIERALFLKRVHDNTDRTMGKVNQHAEKGDWESCRNLVAGRHTPVYNVVRAGINARHEKREVLESILQEAILKELPRLERALPFLNIMAAVAPLLGLLGTVTGMISTFEVINIHGTGDPRLMSGGISVALVTTMLGLMVAIPIMLMHTFLSRQVEHIIGDMEEKSVAMTNIISRYQA